MKTIVKLAIISILFIFSFQKAQCQDEMMIYGKIRIYNDSLNATRLTIKNKTKVVRTETTDAKGGYRIFLKYGEIYTLLIERPNYVPLQFEINLQLPATAKQNGYIPFDLSMHLFKPSAADSLYQGTIAKIEYKPTIKNFNYALDVDYLIQKMQIQAEIDQKKQIADAKRRAEIEDSLRIEQEYLSYINKGNFYYAHKEWSQARTYYQKAKELLPDRIYPDYKLEDIRTAVEIFNQKEVASTQSAPIDTVKPQPAKPQPKPRPEIRPLTPEELNAIFMADLKKKMLEKNPDTASIDKQLANINQITKEVKEKHEAEAKAKEPIVQAQPVVPIEPKPIEPEPKPEEVVAPLPIVAVATDTAQAIDTNIAIVEPIIETHDTTSIETEPEPIVELDTTTIDTSNNTIAVAEPIIEKPVQEPSKIQMVKDFKSYQDSLFQRYSTVEKTIETEEDSFKKLTRVILKRGNIFEVYLKVEHSWGATFYFKERMPREYENITSSYFNFITNQETIEKEENCNNNAPLLKPDNTENRKK